MAQFLDVILYSREQMLKEYEALPYKDGAQDQVHGAALHGWACLGLAACLPACLPRPALAWLAGWLAACLPGAACLPRTPTLGTHPS